MYFAYVIKNENGDLYKGHTEDIERRVEEHNSGATKTTRKSDSWKLAYCEEFKTREEAIKREKYFKSAAGRRFLKSKLVS